jgi:hypothetical protein
MMDIWVVSEQSTEKVAVDEKQAKHQLAEFDEPEKPRSQLIFEQNIYGTTHTERGTR